jgi:hypothetical protein
VGLACVERRLLPAEHSLRAFYSGDRDETAEAATFALRGLLNQRSFVLGVIGEHFCSERSVAGAPRRDVVVLFGHL